MLFLKEQQQSANSMDPVKLEILAYVLLILGQ